MLAKDEPPRGQTKAYLVAVFGTHVGEPASMLSVFGAFFQYSGRAPSRILPLWW